MKHFIEVLVAISCFFSIVTIYCQSVSAAPTDNGNVQIDTTRRGLIQKLCDNAYGKPKIQQTNTRTEDSREISPTPVAVVRSRRTTSPGTAPTPPCQDFNSLSFEELIERNKALLKSVKPITL